MKRYMFFVVVLLVSLLLAPAVFACTYELSAAAHCTDANQILISATFHNAEPKGDIARWTMNVLIVTDYGAVSTVVFPGDTVTRYFPTNLASVPDGTVSVLVGWADGRDGRTASMVEYSGLTCQPNDPVPHTHTPANIPEPTPEPVWAPGGLDEYFAWQAYLASLQPEQYNEPVAGVGYDASYPGEQIGWLFYADQQLALYRAVVADQTVLLPKSGAVRLSNGAIRLHQTQPIKTFAPEENEWVALSLFGADVEVYMLGEPVSVEYGTVISDNTFATCNISWTGIVSFPLNPIWSFSRS